MGLQMDAEGLNAFLAAEFPQVAGDFTVEEVSAERGVRMRLNVTDAHLRPGGTVSGPAMFALADLAIYCVILSRIGPVALAVTTNASFDFMRKPAAGQDLLAECRLLKLGRTLAVGDVLIYSEGISDPVARSAMTYAIPPR
ncbi:PaaI family thioesterase [Paracoccus aerodenitrificans]|uniref:PaaI family thioesterase n=1 Tax=Paracoccus aerodenitrificans TaxID=3017781 RepID=UPI0022F11372|nr:PaaI family thioesterase [Paracoccus aerodenitrificans]WBU63665.1 PaaI family thioesterase [Paracoccus aerodenitrificans]